MSDLAKDLLIQYYGFGAASSGKKFLSIHRNIERVKDEDEKQVTEQHSLTTNDENVANEEFQVIKIEYFICAFIYKILIILFLLF